MFSDVDTVEDHLLGVVKCPSSKRDNKFINLLESDLTQHLALQLKTMGQYRLWLILF